MKLPSCGRTEVFRRVSYERALLFEEKNSTFHADKLKVSRTSKIFAVFATIVYTKYCSSKTNKLIAITSYAKNIILISYPISYQILFQLNLIMVYFLNRKK